MNENLPFIGCAGISTLVIPCASNRLFTFEQLLGGLAAAASAPPCTSVGAVEDIATFCAMAVVAVCNSTDNSTANRSDCLLAISRCGRWPMLANILPILYVVVVFLCVPSSGGCNKRPLCPRRLAACRIGKIVALLSLHRRTRNTCVRTQSKFA